MSSHQQDSIYSNRVHYLWGLIISAADICRIITYTAFFRCPSKSRMLSCLPSEAIVCFFIY